MFQGTEEENVRRTVNVGNPTRRYRAVQVAITVLRIWIFCSAKTGGPESSTSSTSSTKGNNHRKNYNNRVGGEEGKNESRILVSTLHIPVTFTVISLNFGTVMKSIHLSPFLQRRCWDSRS